MSKYIEEAKKFYEEAKREFEDAERTDDKIKMRDASEKAWGAVVLATHELFDRRGVPIPKSHRERRDALRELERKEPKLRAKGFVDRFAARDHNLHEQCFYEGYCEPELIREDLEKVKKFIEDIEKV